MNRFVYTSSTTSLFVYPFFSFTIHKEACGDQIIHKLTQNLSAKNAPKKGLMQQLFPAPEV